jgi:hypothetical protein
LAKPDETIDLHDESHGECRRLPRPCPFVSCRYNLPDRIPADLPSCALDVADEGEHHLEQIGPLLNLTRERVRQIQNETLAKLAKRAGHLLEHLR